MAWLIRLLIGALAVRVARARRAGRPVVDMAAIRGRVDAARGPASIAGLLVVAVVLASFSAALLAAGVTAVALGPVWVGGVLIGLAGVFALTTAPEVLRLRRAVRGRRLRLRARKLSRELDGTRRP